MDTKSDDQFLTIESTIEANKQEADGFNGGFNGKELVIGLGIHIVTPF